MNKVKLDRNKKHIVYEIDGVKIPGYSTIAGELAKPFLVSWANKQGLLGINTTDDKTALHVGTICHFLIEASICGFKPDLDDYAPNDVKRAETAFKGYQSALAGHCVVFLKTELPLVSKTYRYGGTCDIYCEYDGKKTLIDIKTSKAIYGEYKLQIAAYKQLLIENGYEVEDTRIWRVDKEDGSFEDKQIKLTGKEFDLFLRLYDVYKLRKELKI